MNDKDSILFARPDGGLILFIRAHRPVLSKRGPTFDLGDDPAMNGGEILVRTCYTAAATGERVACQSCGLMVRVVSESRISLRFVCLDCEDKELAEATR